jgi:flagellar hook-associated protein 2
MMRSRLSDELIKPMTGAIGDVNILSMIGIGMDRYGSITFDANEFKEALADDFDGTISLISNSQDGLAARMKTMADDYNLTEGVFTLRKSMYQNRSKELGRRVDRMEERVLVVEARLKRQFASMERMMSGLQQQQGALSRL